MSTYVVSHTRARTATLQSAAIASRSGYRLLFIAYHLIALLTDTGMIHARTTAQVNKRVGTVNVPPVLRRNRSCTPA